MAPSSSENKSKATKNTGNFNDRTVRKMVHKASYATSYSEFFGIIYDYIQLLVVRNPALVGDIMDVGIYLLEFHPHLWTSVADSSNFSRAKYLLLLKPVYYEFLLTKHFFCPNPEENINIKYMKPVGVLSHCRPSVRKTMHSSIQLSHTTDNRHLRLVSKMYADFNWL